MDVMARRTRHARARAKTLAALQQRHLIPDVGSPVPVTFFTGDAEHVVAGVPRRAGDRADRKRRAVALETMGDDDPAKVDLAVHVAGTVDPPLDPHEI